MVPTMAQVPSGAVAPVWRTSRFKIDLRRPRVMGVVNLTPDSFSDGGRFRKPGDAVSHCETLLAQGADLLDLGAESSRPGSREIDGEEEWGRLEPVLRDVVRLNVPISIDTHRSQTMQRALDLGADIINDIWALRRPGATSVVSRYPACGVCLMHMHGEPQSMQDSPLAGDAVLAVRQFLESRTSLLLGLGVEAARIAWDPGIGFGKTVDQNLALLARQGELLTGGFPLLVGWSRKSTLGAVTGLGRDDRLIPSVAAALLAVERGARLVRVHDVAETVAALKIWNATNNEANNIEGTIA